jgi:hypothetical protein
MATDKTAMNEIVESANNAFKSTLFFFISYLTNYAALKPLQKI